MPVAGDEGRQVLTAKLALLEREMPVGAEVVHPQPLGPWPLRAGWLLVEEQHVRLDSVRVEDAGRRPQQRVHVELGEQPPPDRLARATLEQDVVRQDDSGAAIDGQDGLDVLNEVELLVARGHPRSRRA
jgi:hypothetical protein